VRSRLFALACLWCGALSVAPARAYAPEVAAVLGRPADSLITALRSLETASVRPAVAAEASLVLGHLYFARAEYRAAADAFSRAAARAEPAAKPEARYWAGLAWLALGQPVQARAALDEVVRAGGPRRADALLGTAQAWDLSDHPDRAFAALAELLEGDSGEVGPAALERYAALAERMGRPEQARRARERLLQGYPRSIEAAASRLAIAAQTAEPGRDVVAVVIGTFIDPARARSLASAAKRAGFPDAQVVSRGRGLSATHEVRLGTYARRGEATKAGEQAERALGVTYKLVRAS
jgi:tetratricopeptide (TPR) repeat protein